MDPVLLRAKAEVLVAREHVRCWFCAERPELVVLCAEPQRAEVSLRYACADGEKVVWVSHAAMAAHGFETALAMVLEINWYSEITREDLFDSIERAVAEAL